jgi:hypothetical protein
MYIGGLIEALLFPAGVFRARGGLRGLHIQAPPNAGGRGRLRPADAIVLTNMSP